MIRYISINILSLFRYDAGDHVAVFPTNNSEMVEKIGQRLNVDLGKVFSLNNVDGKLFIILVLLLTMSLMKYIHIYYPHHGATID